MREITIHCTARDQQVSVLVTDDPVHDGQAPLADAELLCLHVANACTMVACPLGGESPTAMDARLARTGLGPRERATLRGHCAGCDGETELVLSIGGYATCAECGVTQHLEPFPH